MLFHIFFDILDHCAVKTYRFMFTIDITYLDMAEY